MCLVLTFFTDWNAITSGTSQQKKSCPKVIIKTGQENVHFIGTPKELKAYLGYEKEEITPQHSEITSKSK